MQGELYFIYDLYCPWSYASTALIKRIQKKYTQLEIHLCHCDHYDGTSSAGYDQVQRVKAETNMRFSAEYLRFVDSPKKSTVLMNFMTWVQEKQPKKALEILSALQDMHFVDGMILGSKRDFNFIIEDFKLSPPNKVFQDKLTNESEYALSELQELQEFMGTNAFPALLLCVDDNAVLLDHARYLNDENAMITYIETLLESK
ncbi:protein-disulfide isomerase [Psychromonas sp. CNPT3]|uniref:protein disulfide-isomerase n=1 Tax=Psychromonas sp. CNPT3 TaxID=314282 RepID=UPI0002C09F3E|nr:protein disulfide-isomerase [Psychromonas sp. CNPT3]AGH81106.1 protein-disulfide isomerase [Psychromonas sp. CNPT3]